MMVPMIELFAVEWIQQQSSTAFRLIDWLTGVIGWLIDWLVDWLTDWLITGYTNLGQFQFQIWLVIKKILSSF